MTPLDKLMLSSVKCLTCGAGYGQCDCAARARQKEVDDEYERLMKLSDADLIAVCEQRGVRVKR